MTRAMLRELAVLFSVESCGPGLIDPREEPHCIPVPDPDEAMRLSAISAEMMARADAMRPRLVPRHPSSRPPRAA